MKVAPLFTNDKDIKNITTENVKATPLTEVL